MRKALLKFIVTLSFITTYSQNDICSNAFALTPTTDCNTPTTGTFSGSSISSAAPNCASNSLQDVWYSFVATAPTMRVSLFASIGLNHGFEIIQNNCNGQSLVCINSNSSSLSESYINNNFVVGESYLIRVFNASNNLSTASFQICIQNYPSPNNDVCSNAINLIPTADCSNPTTGSFSGSSSSSAGPSCATNSLQDVWYSFIATDPTMRVSLFASNGLNHGFEIITISCLGNSQTCVNNNGSSISESYLNNNFVVGQTYYIRVFNVNANISITDFQICVQNYPIPSNNECANPITLTPTSNCGNPTTGTFSGSSISNLAPSCGSSSSQDIWFQFLATNTSINIYLSPASGLNHGFEIIQNTCGSTSLACVNSNGISISESYNYTNYVIGQMYLIRVFNVSNNLSIASFQICIEDSNLNLNNNSEPIYAIHPNPTKDIINIQSYETIKEITVYDILGGKVIVDQVSSNILDVSNLAQGIYIIKVKGENDNIFSDKFIKQ